MSSSADNELRITKKRGDELAETKTAENLQEAIGKYKHIIRNVGDPVLGGDTLFSLALAHVLLALEANVDPEKNLERAVGYYDAFIGLFDKAKVFPLHDPWGQAKCNQGIAYSRLSTNLAVNHKRALQCFDDAIEYFS